MSGLKCCTASSNASVSCQRPDQIFVIGDPCGQSRAEPALSQPMDKIRQPQRCMYTRPSAKSALLATCNSNGLRSTNCRCITMRTPQSLRGGTMLTSRTRIFSPIEAESAVSLSQKISVAGVLQISSYFCCSRKRYTPLEIACLTDGAQAIQPRQNEDENDASHGTTYLPAPFLRRPQIKTLNVSQEACKFLKSLQVDKLLRRFLQSDGIAQF